MNNHPTPEQLAEMSRLLALSHANLDRTAAGGVISFLRQQRGRALLVGARGVTQPKINDVLLTTIFDISILKHVGITAMKLTMLRNIDGVQFEVNYDPNLQSSRAVIHRCVLTILLTHKKPETQKKNYCTNAPQLPFGSKEN